MDNVFQARIAALAEKYLKGEEIYNALKENRPEGVDIIINPQHIGDTLWVCIFLDAYKKKFGCKQILAVVPEYQTELAQLFTQIDDVLGLTAEEITALQSYIGFNQLWYSDHIRYGFFHYTISLNNSGVFFNSMFMGARDHNFMNKSRREFLELDDDCIKNGSIAPNPPESASKYSNAVMILPAARTQLGDIPESFWKKMVDMIKDKGYEVYCNYNNLPYETLVEGTIPLSTKLVELYNLSRSFKRFIGFRSGILDLIALGEGNITCLHPTYMDIDGLVMERDANISDHLYQLNSLESLQAYQYRSEWEDELLKVIVENI